MAHIRKPWRLGCAAQFLSLLPIGKGCIEGLAVVPA